MTPERQRKLSPEQYAKIIDAARGEWHVKPLPCTRENAGIATIVDMFVTEMAMRLKMRKSARQLMDELRRKYGVR